jgi:hypothetical protein
LRSRGDRTTRRGRRARLFPERAPAPQGWDTSDEQEVELRRWRGRTEISAVEALEPEHPVFGAFRVRSENGSGCEVEIRTLNGPDNSGADQLWSVRPDPGFPVPISSHSDRLIPDEYSDRRSSIHAMMGSRWP